MGWDTSDRRQRLPDDWPTRRQVVLTRDGHRCTWVVDGTRCPDPATDVDHIVNNDDHSYDNLTSLCAPHHRTKTAAEAAAGRRRSGIRRPTEPHPGLKRPNSAL